MKKVLVLAVAMMLVAVVAFAGVNGTKHDIPGMTGATFGGGATAATAEICVFCHTPHGANTAVDTLLWNRTFGTDPTVFAPYTSATSTAMASVTGLSTVAMLCLSCHDGSTAVYTVDNPANSGTVTAVGDVASHISANKIIGNAVLTNDMSNDHPIGFDYSAVAAIDSGLQPAASMTLPLQGTLMDCSTCHNVHDNTYAPFLRMANSASALCTHCHTNK